jgi:hypothetical protein
MKSFLMGFLFFIGMVIFAEGQQESQATTGQLENQISGIVISDFTARARDISADEAIIITDMFMDALAATRTVTVVGRSVLEKELTAMDFITGDWSDNTKTTQLGIALNADLLVSGTITQLGASITFNITVRDIKTLAVISSVQQQYTVEKVWDNFDGIPGQLPNAVNYLSSGINTEIAKRQEERRQELARLERERQQDEYRHQQESYSIVGVWAKGYKNDRGTDNLSGSNYTDGNYDYYQLQFNSDGTFTGTVDRWFATISNYWEIQGNVTYSIVEYRGSYTREGTNITLLWNSNRTNVLYVQDRRGRFEQRSSSNVTDSGSKTYPFTFTLGSSPPSLFIRGFEDFPELRKR